jgi:hypothetical protein
MRQDDLHITSSSLEEDDDPRDEGLVALLTPEGADISDDTEDNDAFDALREDLSPGEAERVLETMRPLDDEEAQILEDMPELGTLRRVDDPAEQEWLADRLHDGYTAMDKVLKDSVFGDNMDNDERLERTGHDTATHGDDIGWGIPGLSSLKKAARGVARGARGAYKYGKKGMKPLDPRWAAKKLGGLVKKFVPSRDAGKAKMVQGLNAKLIREHANWLAQHAQRSGQSVQPLGQYINLSRPWARQKLAAAGLPTSTVVRGADVLGSDILGADVMGAWWNPLSWFQEKVNVVVNQTQGERASQFPGGQPGDPNAMDPSMDPSATDPYAAQDPYAQDPNAQDPYAQDPYASQEAYPDYAYGENIEVGISGEDSLGAFATEILSGEATTSRPAPGAREDELVQIAAAKLGSGQSLRAGEVAVLATLAKAGHPRASRIYALLLKEGAAVPVAGDDSGAWAYMLNPANWFKSSKEREFRAKEIDAWKENADLQKQLKKRGEVLAQAERAKSATEAVAAARAQAAATEAQLKAIEASLSGVLRPADSSGFDTLVGHEKPTAVVEVVKLALDKLGKRKRASEIYAKVSRGESLDKGELRDARGIAQLLGKIKVVHGGLKEETPPELSMLHGAFVGACLSGAIESARKQNSRNGKVATALAKKISSGQPLAAPEKKVLYAVLESSSKLQGLARSVASGACLRGLDGADQLRNSALVGAAKVAMTDVEKKMLASITKLAKAGNPRAVKALQQLRSTGAIVGGDHVGSVISSAFKYATMPITLPAKHLYQAAKWTGKKLGIVKTPASPEQARLSRMQAAAKRRAAALARARAADAQTKAELRAQQSIADAADAEAEAADALALSQEAAMRTKEIEADPEQAYAEDDTSGAFVGSWEEFVGADSPSIRARLAKKPDPFDSGSPEMKRAMREKQLVAKASEKSAAGAKIRSGAALYSKAKKGDPQAKKAIETMVAKAKKGDKQAIIDTRAVQAGRQAVIARQKAQKRERAVLASRARKARGVAFQKKAESLIANKLVRVERKIELRKLAKVERRAAAGNKKAVAYVQKQVAAAKKGDKRSASRVEKLRLAKEVRKAAPTKRERRNLAAAGRLYAKATRGNPKAVRQVLVIEAAAKKGNPNAKRAQKRLAIAKVTFNTIEAGVVVGRPKKASRPGAAPAEVVASAKSKLEAGTASREELAAGARAAQATGDKKTAGELAVAATRSPAATETLKKTATVVAAKEAGNPEAKAAVAETFAAAREGDPAAIKKMGNVVAVQTLDDVNKGRPVPEAMRDAVNLQERAAIGDPAAVEITRKVSEAATSDSPTAEAIAAAVTLSAAAVTARALAAKPRARQEFMQKVNAVPAADLPAAERALDEGLKKAEAGTITPEEGETAVHLAERLGKPRVAAKIAALAPPPPPSTAMSTLPDVPLPPITGVLSLLRESLRAVTMSTRDPVANWRQGVSSRAAAAAPATPTTSSGMGWSPFGIFKKLAKYAPIIAPATGILASTASLAMAVDAKKSRPAPAPAAPATPPAATPVENVSAKASPSATSAESVEGEGDDSRWNDLRDLMADAVRSKKMSRSSFNRGVELATQGKKSHEEKLAQGKKLLAFLSKRGVEVDMQGDDLPPLPDDVRKRIQREIDAEGVLPPEPQSKKRRGQPVSSLGSEKSFRDYVVAALNQKKISRRDFNRAVEIQSGPSATTSKKAAVGEAILKYLASKSIKIEA